MRRKRFRAFLALGLFVAGPAGAQVEPSPADLASDFDALVRIVQETHPDPYGAFGGREGFEAEVARYRERARDLATRRQLHALAQRFLATLKDGHTGMSSLPRSGEEPPRWAPLVLGVATDALYVRGVTGGVREYLGSKVLAINHLEVDRVVDSIRVHFPSENAYGGMERLRRLLVLRTASWPPVLLRQDPLQLTLETPARDTLTLDVRYGDDPPELVRESTGPDLAGDNPLLYGRILERGELRAGYFVWNAVVSREVAQQAYARNPDDAQGTFDWVFQNLRGVSRTGDPERDLELIPSLYERFAGLLREMKSEGVADLIIDLRRNGGGMTPLVYPLLYMLYGDEVVRSDLEAEYDVRVSRLYLSQQGWDDIDEYNAQRGTELSLGDVRGGFLFKNDLSRPLDERRSSEYLTYGGEAIEALEGSAGQPLYSPRVVVLCAPATFSAAFHFLYFLHEIGSATVVGVPPRQAPNAFMEGTRFQLPRSGLSGTVSNAVQRLYPDDPERGRVFTPDWAMSWEDFRRYGFHPDAEVLFALDLIESGRIGGE